MYQASFVANKRQEGATKALLCFPVILVVAHTKSPQPTIHSEGILQSQACLGQQSVLVKRTYSVPSSLILYSIPSKFSRSAPSLPITHMSFVASVSYNVAKILSFNSNHSIATKRSWEEILWAKEILQTPACNLFPSQHKPPLSRAWRRATLDTGVLPAQSLNSESTPVTNRAQSINPQSKKKHSLLVELNAIQFTPNITCSFEVKVVQFLWPDLSHLPPRVLGQARDTLSRILNLHNGSSYL